MKTIIDKQRFNRLVSEWRDQTINLSSIQEMIAHSAYQEIISMGKDVVPLILEEMRRKPEFLFYALRKLTGENPVKKADRGNVSAMTQSWLDWGVEKRLIK